MIAKVCFTVFAAAALGATLGLGMLIGKGFGYRLRIDEEESVRRIRGAYKPAGRQPVAPVQLRYAASWWAHARGALRELVPVAPAAAPPAVLGWPAPDRPDLRTVKPAAPPVAAALWDRAKRGVIGRAQVPVPVGRHRPAAIETSRPRRLSTVLIDTDAFLTIVENSLRELDQKGGLW